MDTTSAQEIKITLDVQRRMLTDAVEQGDFRGARALVAIIRTTEIGFRVAILAETALEQAAAAAQKALEAHLEASRAARV